MSGAGARRRVAIVGGGITGLSAAHALEQARIEKGAPLEYTVFEASARLGGNIRTRREGDYLIDEGPDNFVVSKPHAAALCRAVGLGARLIETQPASRGLYVARGGRLLRMPEGYFLTIPTRAATLLRTPVLSWRAKARVALDLVLPRRTPGGDESMGCFVTRRFGREAAEQIAEPLLAGIYAGDPDTLSIHATFPQLVALEDEHGGLIHGARAALAERAALRPAGAPPPSPFYSLPDGMSEMVDAVARRLAPDAVRTNTAVTAITRAGGGDGETSGRWTLALGDGTAFEADTVLLAAPMPAVARLLEPHDEVVASLLREVPHLSTATAFLAFARREVAHPLDASGFIVPRRERLRISASTWVSQKWPGRAPDDQLLLRVFFGGARAPDMPELPDDELLAIARAEIAPLMGVTAEPRYARVFRYMNANPQMNVGHRDRIRRVHARLARLGGLLLAGGGVDGVGIPDCIKHGEAAAGRIVANALAAN